MTTSKPYQKPQPGMGVRKPRPGRNASGSGIITKVPASHAGTVPLSTLRPKPTRVFGSILAATVLSGFIIGSLLAVGLYLFSLVSLIRPLDPPGNPAYSLAALAMLDAADVPGAGPSSPASPDTEKMAALETAQAEHAALQRIMPRSDRQVRNILLITPQLADETDPIRTEAVLLLSINKRSRTASLIAFDRTMPANVPGKGWALLGHAANMGGPDLIRETLTDNYRIQVDDAFVFDFAGLAAAIDRLDGITLPLNAEEEIYLRQYDPQLFVLDDTSHNGSRTGAREGGNADVRTDGQFSMDGRFAVAYCQITTGGHMEQNRRLLNVLSAAFARSASLSVFDAKDFARQFMPALQTSLPPLQRYRSLLDVFKARAYPLTALAWTTKTPVEPIATGGQTASLSAPARELAQADASKPEGRTPDASAANASRAPVDTVEALHRYFYGP